MARLYTQTCSEKVDGVCVIEGIFGPGKDEMVEMIPGETAPKAGKSTLGGASCGGGVAVREGVRGRHEGTLLVSAARSVSGLRRAGQISYERGAELGGLHWRREDGQGWRGYLVVHS